MQVRWYKRALTMLDNALEYTMETFGENSTRKFYNNIKKCEESLANNPHLGKIEPLLAHRKREYRSLVVHKSFKFIYYIKADSICIIALWNCKQNPRKLSQ